jgi:hypothetical protein
MSRFDRRLEEYKRSEYEVMICWSEEDKAFMPKGLACPVAPRTGKLIGRHGLLWR